MIGSLAVILAGLLTAAPQPRTASVFFEVNRGQLDPGVAFLSRGQSSSLALAADGRLFVTLARPDGTGPARISFVPVGATTPQFLPLERQTAVLNILRGRDSAKWLRGVPLYGRVRAAHLYPGVDVEYYGNGSRQEYDFIVAPGTRPETIRLRLDGGSVRHERDGSLVVATSTGEVRQPKPIAYQVVEGARRMVDVSYALSGSTVTFDVGRYDRSRALIIDPLLVTSTFVGGTHDVVNQRSTFTADAFYLTGETTDGGAHDVYVAKYTIDGRTLQFATVYGGSGLDSPAGIAVDDQNVIYIAGTTASADLPTAGQPLQPGLQGGSDGFLVKLAADGASPILSTYFGSSGADTVNDLVLGTDIYIAVTLSTGGSTFFPTSSPNLCCGFTGFVARFDRTGLPLRLQRIGGATTALALGPDGTVYVNGGPGATPGAFQTTPGSSTCTVLGGRFVMSVPCRDGFVSRYSADLSTQLWGTFLRETAPQSRDADDKVVAIKVDTAGNVTVLGATHSASFPVTPGAFDSTCIPCSSTGVGFLTSADVPFIAKLNPSGSALIFSTFLNGSASTYVSDGHPSSDASPRALALDALGNIFVAGDTWNPAFPSAGPPLPQASSLGVNARDAFLTAFTPSGALLYSSRLGGSGDEGVTSLTASRYGTVAVLGHGDSTFPMQDAQQTTGSGGFLSVVSVPRIFIVLEAPLAGTTRAAGVPIRGWAVDTGATSGTGIDAVDISATPSAGGSPIFLGTATLGGSRSDVALALGSSQFTSSGFSLTVALPPGQYTISATPHSSVTAAFGQPATVQVSAISGTVARIQSPSAGTLSSKTLTLSGYAADLDAPSGTGVDTVHVWAYPAGGAPPVFVGVANYGESRAVVADMFGAQFTQSGFSLSATLAPGTYTIATHAHSTVTGVFSAVDTVTITVPASAMELHVSVPTGPSVYQGFTIGGWVIDAGAPSGSGVDAVHVWGFPQGGGAAVFLGYTTSFIARQDVGQARGLQFLFSGFNVKTTASLAPGTYQVVTFARSTVTGQFDAADSRVLTVMAATGPVFEITDLADGARVKGFLVLTGFAFDPRATQGSGIDAIQMYVYPDWGSGKPAVFMGGADHSTSSPDVSARFGAQFDATGVRAFYQLLDGPGKYMLALFAHSTVDGTYTLVTRLVTVPAPEFAFFLDSPRAGSTVSSPVRISGWAIDRAEVDVTPADSGIEFVQIYAYPVAGGPPTLVCQESHNPRPDVAAAFGPRFLNSGFDCQPNMAPGTYDLAVYLFSNRTRQYSPPSVFRFTVQ